MQRTFENYHLDFLLAPPFPYLDAQWYYKSQCPGTFVLYKICVVESHHIAFSEFLPRCTVMLKQPTAKPPQITTEGGHASARELDAFENCAVSNALLIACSRWAASRAFSLCTCWLGGIYSRFDWDASSARRSEVCDLLPQILKSQCPSRFTI